MKIHFKPAFALTYALLVAVPVVAFASVNDDAVTSIKIKEADNNGSQDTNSGSGVKTNHIQDLAVTDAKIAGPISASKITQGSGSGLDADKLDGQHATAFAASTHTHTASAISSGTIDIDRLATYANTRIVHKGAVDGINSFSTIGAALDSITDAGEGNRYLVRVMPGVYAESVTMKEYVDVQGVSTDDVSIRYTGASNLPSLAWNVGNAVLSHVTIYSPYSGQFTVVINGGSAIFRDVAIIMDYMPPFSMVYGVESGGSLQMERCILRSNIGKYGLHNYGAVLSITDSLIEVNGADGYGIITSSSGVLRNTQVSVNSPNNAYAVYLNGGVLKVINCDLSVAGVSAAIAISDSYGSGTVVNNSRIDASCSYPNNARAIVTRSMQIIGSSLTSNGYAFSGAGSVDAVNSTIFPDLGCLQSGTARIANSQILGGTAATVGVEKVVNCYDENFTPIANVP